MPQTMLRYDPTKQDHTKYLAKGKRKQQIEIEEVNSKKSKVNDDPANDVEVSKEQFYKVNTNLTSTLLQNQNNGTEFSLLSMFGTTLPTAPAETKSAYRENLLATNTQKQIADMTNPFSYDSSDDDGNEERKSNTKIPESSNKKSLEQNKQRDGSNKSKTINSKTAKVWQESFFIFSNEDDRLKGKYYFIFYSLSSSICFHLTLFFLRHSLLEGENFFIPISKVNGDAMDDDDEYLRENKQKEMRNILKKKVKRSIKSALPHGAKPTKRFRKFVRHL